MSIHNARRSGNALLAKWGGSLSLSLHPGSLEWKKRKKRGIDLSSGVLRIYIYIYIHIHINIYIQPREKERHGSVSLCRISSQRVAIASGLLSIQPLLRNPCFCVPFLRPFIRVSVPLSLCTDPANLLPTMYTRLYVFIRRPVDMRSYIYVYIGRAKVVALAVGRGWVGSGNP